MPVVDDDGQIVARDMVTLRWTFDERITDGYYAAQALSLFAEYMKDPAQFESAMDP